MRLRESSELGWLMLQLLGALCMPLVTRDAQVAAAAARARMALGGRKSGKAAALRALETIHAEPFDVDRRVEETPCADCGASLFHAPDCEADLWKQRR